MPLKCQHCKAGFPALGWPGDPLWNNSNCVHQVTGRPCTREDALAGTCIVQGSCQDTAQAAAQSPIGQVTGAVYWLAIAVIFIAVLYVLSKTGALDKIGQAVKKGAK